VLTSLLTLTLFMTPLAVPENVPADTIYMGEHIEPIKGERSRCKSLTGFCMTLTLRGFLQVKDAVQNQPNLCHLAVEESAKACQTQAEALADLVSAREIEDQKVIDAFKLKLSALEGDLAQTSHERLRWKWAAIGVSSLSVILTTIIIIKD